jgi:hypothetical protein
MGLTTKEISSSSFNDMISSVDRRSEYVENRAGANVRLNNFLTPYTLDDKSSILNAPCGYSNGVYPSLRPVQTFGPEVITNGTFDTDSDWTKGTGWSISGGKAIKTSGTGSGLYQTVPTTTVGKKYKFTFDAIVTSGAANATIYGVTIPVFSTSGSQEHTITATLTSGFQFYGTADFAGSIDNVSVKEVIDADFDFTRGSAATRVTKDGLIKNVQILSDELVQNGDFEEIGPEEVINGDFATDLSGWTTVGTNATNTITWEQGGARIISTNANISIAQYNRLTVGKTYKFTCNVDVEYGSIGLYQPLSQATLVEGFNEIYFTASTSTLSIKRISTVSNCLLDNVSVKEVGQNWTFGTGWSMGDGKANAVNASNQSLSQSTSSVLLNKKYRISFDVEYISGSAKFQLVGGTTQDVATITSSGTQVIEVVSNANKASYRVKGLTTGGGFNGSIDNVSVIEITDDTDLPRIDYTDGTGSLLLEPQSTNLLTYSEDFSFWSINEVTTQTGFLAPDGSSNATKVVSTGSNSYIVKSGGVFGNYARTIYARTVSGTGTLQLLSHNTNTNNSFTITENWQRFELNSTTEIASNFYAVDFRGSSTLSEVIIWGAQAEDLSYATSYIPTSGSTVTRNADVCNNAGSSDLINSTEGVLYAEIATLTDTNTNRAISISDGTLNNRVVLRINSDDLYSYVQSNGTYSMFKSTTISEITNYNKIAVKYKENDFALWVNGSSIAVDTTGNSPIGLNILEFQEANGTSDFYGRVRSVAVFKEALTDEELAKITSTTQQEVFYEMKDRMLQIDADYYEFGDYTTRLKKLF